MSLECITRGYWLIMDPHDAEKWYLFTWDGNVKAREDEKMEKYSTLSTEIRSTYRVQTESILIVIGALGTVPKRLSGFLKSLGIPDVIGCMQTCALLGSQRILKNALSIWRVMSLFWHVCVFIPWVCSLVYVFWFYVLFCFLSLV